MPDREPLDWAAAEPEPPIWPALAFLDEFDASAHVNWMVINSGTTAALYPISEELLPLRARTHAWAALVAEVLAALLGLDTLADPELDPRATYTLRDEHDRPLEKVTAGHFKPASSPGGKIVSGAEFFLRAAAVV